MKEGVTQGEIDTGKDISRDRLLRPFVENMCADSFREQEHLSFPQAFGPDCFSAHSMVQMVQSILAERGGVQLMFCVSR